MSDKKMSAYQKIKAENNRLKEEHERMKEEMGTMYHIICNDGEMTSLDTSNSLLNMTRFNIGLMLDKFKEMSVDMEKYNLMERRLRKQEEMMKDMCEEIEIRKKVFADMAENTNFIKWDNSQYSHKSVVEYIQHLEKQLNSN